MRTDTARELLRAQTLHAIEAYESALLAEKAVLEADDGSDLPEIIERQAVKWSVQCENHLVALILVNAGIDVDYGTEALNQRYPAAGISHRGRMWLALPDDDDTMRLHVIEDATRSIVPI